MRGKKNKNTGLKIAVRTDRACNTAATHTVHRLENHTRQQLAAIVDLVSCMNSMVALLDVTVHYLY